MKNPIRYRSRAVLGTLLLVLAGACADAPSSPVFRLPVPPSPLQPTPRAADNPLLDAGLPSLLPGETIRRRALVDADGQAMQVASVIGVNGLPRTTLVRRQGAVIIRVDNDWSAGTGWDAVTQQVAVRGTDGAVRRLDSRSISSSERAAALASLRREAASALSSVMASRIRRLEEDGGACDAQVKAADIATWQYTAAAGALMLASLTGTPTAVSLAFSAYLASYANYESKQADLDKCVDAIGKKPTYDEY